MDLKENVYSSTPWLANYLQLAQVWLNPVRQIGWWILTGLGSLVDILYDAYLALVQIDIYGMISSSLSRVTGGIEDLWPAILTLTVTITGFIIMITAKKRKDLGNGIAVAVLLLITGPMLFSTCNNFLKASVPWVQDAYGVGQTTSVYIDSGVLQEVKKYDTRVSTKVITSGTYDLLTSVKNETLTKISSKPENIRINEKVGGYFGNSEYFPYAIERVDPDGTMWGRKLSDDAFFMKNEINEGVYRYSFSFFGPFVTLLIMLIGISMGAFKTAKLMFELVFTQTLAPLVFASDVTNSGRSKEVVKKVLSTYILIAIVFYGLMLFMTLSLWALDERNVPSTIVRVFLLAGIAWGMIDGPDIVIKLLGIDAGVRSGFGALVGAGMAVGGASRLIRGGANLAKGIGKNVADKVPQAAGIMAKGAKEQNAITKKSFGEAGIHSSKKPTARGQEEGLPSPGAHAAPPSSMASEPVPRQNDSQNGTSTPAAAAGSNHQSPLTEQAKERGEKTPPSKTGKDARGQKAAANSQRQQRNYRVAFPPNPTTAQTGSGAYMAPPDLNQIDQIIENSRPASPQASTHLPPPGIKPMPPKSKPPERGDRK